MTYKNMTRKAKVGFSVVREHGILSFMIMSLQFIQKHVSKKAKGVDPIHTKVRYNDAIHVDFNSGLPSWPGTKSKQLTFNWLMPPPGKGSGGHLNIFRFIKFLEDTGHICRIYMYVDGEHGSVGAVHAIMGDSYPPLEATSKMQWLDEANDMEPADGIFATSWETAYASFTSNVKARRFYFVQDFEPYFYPIGSLYALAENSYKFGFYGITAGGWLSTKLSRDYGMQTDHFDFGSDKSTYFYENGKQRKEIFFYARPYTERRGFEVGIMALDLFHKKHPGYIINLAGWDVSNYKIPFPYVNLQTLEISQLNDVYNRCAAALVLSYTNMSLLPLELLGSGTIPVVNDGENNVLVSNNEYIVYTMNDPLSLAQSLSEVVSRKDLVEHSKLASKSVHGATWEESGRKFVAIVERETRKHD